MHEVKHTKHRHSLSKNVAAPLQHSDLKYPAIAHSMPIRFLLPLHTLLGETEGSVSQWHPAL